MARLPRLRVPGLPFHVRVRGNDGQPIFHTEGDRIYLHRCLVDATRRHGVAVHAYVFMGNHVHLLATPEGEDSLSRALQSVGRRYVSYFNYVRGRTGTLWEGRFRSCPVESDRYFLVCHRYVELNPVRAGLSADPGQFGWSSFRCNALGRADDLVSPHSLYMELGRAEEARRAAYRRLFEDDLEAPTLAAIRHAAARGWALGGEKFCRLLEQQSGRPAAIRKAGRPRGARSGHAIEEITAPNLIGV